MKFKLDENTPFILKKIIEKTGNHQVDSVYHEKLAGIDDKTLIKICSDNQRILITLDSDFINISKPFYGIIVLRPQTQGKEAVKKIFLEFLNNFSLKDVPDKIIIVEPNQIRVRV